MGNHLRCDGCQLGGHPWPSSNPSGNIFAQRENLAVDTRQSGALAESRQCSKPFRHEGYHCRYLSASHLIKPLLNYSGKSRLVLRLELRPFCRALCLLLTPQIPRGTQESGRRKELSREVHHSRLTSSAPLANALCSQVQLPRRLTSRPVPAVPRGMGIAKKHPPVYKQLSSAGPDPPKGSGAGIVPVPGRCWEIQLGAGCSCSWSVTQSAGKGLNSIPGLTTHLL